MKELVFLRGSAIRKVFIDGRRIAFLIAELNNVPLTVDLGKLDESEETIKKMGLDKGLFEELAELRTETDLIIDITEDLEKAGWRLHK